MKHCPYNPEQLRKQTELAEIWKSYRSRPGPQIPSPPPPLMTIPKPSPSTSRPLLSSSQYNTRMGSSPTFLNTSSSASSSPLMSPNSSGYFSTPSSPGYSNFSSPVRQQQQPQQYQQHHHHQQNLQQLQPNENIVYENLMKLLQIQS